jgi:hypothetical protein
VADLISAADYKTYAGISATTWDTVLGVLATAVSVMIRRWCDRDETTGFEGGAAKTEYYDGNGSATIQLREWPVISITSVSERDAAGNLTALESTDYRADLRTGTLARHTASYGRLVSMDGFPSIPGFGHEPCWSGGYQNWKVVYTAGYTTIPGDIKLACYKVMDALFAERRKDMAGLQSESLGDYSYVNKPLGDYEVTLKKLAAPFLSHYMTGGV